MSWEHRRWSRSSDPTNSGSCSLVIADRSQLKNGIARQRYCEMQTVTELEVYQPGELTVIGFGGREILDHLNVADCRVELTELIREYHCKALAFDLTGVRLISSDLLGLVASIQCRGIEIHLFHPSDAIREMLEITKLDQFLHVHELDV